MRAEELVTQIVPAIAPDVVKGGPTLGVDDGVLNQNDGALVVSFCIFDLEYCTVIPQSKYFVSCVNILLRDGRDYEWM